MKPSAILISRFFPRLRKSSRVDFAWRLFARNNLTLVVSTGFLVVEQLCYALFVSTAGSALQTCYYVSALLAAVFFAFSYSWSLKKPQRLTLLHRSLPAILVFVGMAVVLIRFIYVEFDPVAFRVPTLYIAVLYGSAVLFVISPWVNLTLYLFLTLSAIFIMPFVHPEVMGRFYVADLISNGIVAFIFSLLNYCSFAKSFTVSKSIEGKNEALISKNEEIRRINKQLKMQSEQDELTQLFNRRKINLLLRELSNKFAQSKDDFSLILLDVDHFKNVNDSYGHATGDLVLKQISQILLDHVRDSDSCGRWGGEEFIVVCPGINCREASPLAERLRQLICSALSEGPIVTASFGVACYSRSGGLTQLLHTADACLYTAKSKGRNHVISDDDQNQLEMFSAQVAELQI